jgi:hypothetical protein
VPDVQEDEVIQRFGAQREVEPFDVRRRIRRAVGDGKALDPDHFGEPEIELTSVAAILLATSPPVAVLAEDPIVVGPVFQRAQRDG